MAMIVTANLIAETHNLCVQELTRAISGCMPEEEGNRLALDVSGALQVLAWRLLVPMFIGVTSKIAADKLTARRFKEKSVSELKADALATVGKTMDVGNPDRLEECVIVIEELLKPFQVTRQQARDIIKLLVTRIQQAV